MFETYRMLGRERENELLAEAQRLRPLSQRPSAPTRPANRGLHRSGSTWSRGLRWARDVWTRRRRLRDASSGSATTAGGIGAQLELEGGPR
jgi:hypothetical protein